MLRDLAYTPPDADAFSAPGGVIIDSVFRLIVYNGINADARSRIPLFGVLQIHACPKDLPRVVRADGTVSIDVTGKEFSAALGVVFKINGSAQRQSRVDSRYRTVTVNVAEFVTVQPVKENREYSSR